MTMRPILRSGLFAVAAALLFASDLCRASAQTAEPAARISDEVVKIGLILDMSGPYADNTGEGSATAARMAVEDFGGKVLGAPIEVVTADHHDSADRAGQIARDWFDKQHVDAIMEVSGSSEALIVQRIADTRHKIVSLSGPGAERLSNEACTATSIHYVFDTYAIAHTVGAALVDKGEKTWFFVTVDYSFGYDLENETAAVVEQSGGTVVGRARHPLDAADFSSYLARARESKAKVIGLADAGTDMENAIKQAAKLGMIPGPQTLAALSLRINGVQALGLQTTQGLVLSESFYWDLDEATRAWSKRFFAKLGKMPNAVQAGVYSSTMHYLQAVAKTGTDATDPVMAAMRAAPINDFFAHDGHIRADGLMVHDMRLFQVKAPSESKYDWDDLRLVATIPGDKAFQPLSQSKCPLVQH
jgi:branched-chain amino acid transport system substrate-binding protein